MQFLKKAATENFWQLVIVCAFAILAGIWLLKPGYFNIHDDLQMMRQLAMEECFRDLQIPCRWTPHMGYGYGFPLFNYYPPLPYIFGEVFRVFGVSFVDTVKLTFLFSFIFSGLAMYVLGREFWGKLGGVITGIFYIWAPYHAVDVYVRGAMNEAWALIWFPILLWATYKLITKARFRYVVILALSFFGLLTSHNLMVIIFAPLLSVWVLFWLVRTGAWFTVLYLLLSGIWSIGLAAFFTLPVFLEQKYVHVETLIVGYYEYIAHFANIDQLLISRFWGYGASVWMALDDKMSFQVGHVHWVISLIVLLLTILDWKNKKNRNLYIISLLIVSAGWFAVFMAHSRSAPIWTNLDMFLKFVQFPWRFLTLAIFCFSFAAGMVFWYLKDTSLRFIVAITLVLVLVLPNLEYFKPEKLGKLTDEEKFSGVAWEMQQTAGIYDYLPIDAKTAPKSPRKVLVEIIEGKGKITDAFQNTNSARFKAKIETDSARLQINIFKFPGWKIFVNGSEVIPDIGIDELARMHINLGKGEYEVKARLENTPARFAGNTLSLFFWAGLLTIPLWRKKQKKY